MEEYKNYYKGKTILIVGGAGAVGANLTSSLSDLGAETIIVLDNLSSSYLWNIPDLPNVLFINGDVTSEIDLKRAFAEKPEIVFHLAAFFANQNSIDYPQMDLNTNGLGTLLLLQYAAMNDVSRFVYASSGCSIYGSSSPLPLKEDFFSMHMTTPYQITKMLGELYTNFFYHHHGLNIVNARLFNSFGPGEVPGQYRNVIPNFIYMAMNGLQLPFTGQPDATRDFTYVEDIVDGFLRCGYFDKAVGQSMNLAAGREIKVLEMAKLVNELTGNDAGIAEAPKRKWDTKNRLLAAIDVANSSVGYKPKMDFKEGLLNTIDWFKNNWDNIQRDAEFPPGMSSATRKFGVKKDH
tara:strand:- start:2929 stop:3978 length:1050 start_codon:yes stop_codon:yes gene_type:complete